MDKSENIADFAAAMAKVQAEIGGAVKGNVNPHFKSKYADLSAVWEAWQPIGPKNGFAVLQFPGVFDRGAGTMGMDQIITHSSGQWISGHMTIPLSKIDAQGYGSACTYARRYALAAGVGICPEDDDGNAASRPQSEGQTAATITQAQFDELSELAAETNTDNRQFCTFFKIDAARNLPAGKFDEAMKMLRKKLPKSEPMKEAA